MSVFKKNVAEKMFHAETKILSLPPKGSTGRCTTTSATGGEACGSTSGGCCM
jgi:hypothetical protein